MHRICKICKTLTNLAPQNDTRTLVEGRGAALFGPRNIWNINIWNNGARPFVGLLIDTKQAKPHIYTNKHSIFGIQLNSCKHGVYTKHTHIVYTVATQWPPPNTLSLPFFLFGSVWGRKARVFWETHFGEPRGSSNFPTRERFSPPTHNATNNIVCDDVHEKNVLTHHMHKVCCVWYL